MAEYEFRKIRGWRGLLEDAAADIKMRIWMSPARTVYKDGLEAPRCDEAIGKPIWFTRVFGQERVATSYELTRLRNVQRQIKHRERTSEQRERDSMRRHQQYLLRRSKQSEAEHAIELATCRQRRSLRSDEQRRLAANMARLWRLKNLELSKAISKRAKAKHKDKARERRRVHRLENIEAIRASERGKRHSKVEKRRALACVPGAGEELAISQLPVPN
jgi:hypothetical protein